MSTRDFSARVLSAVRRIPPGRVATYGDVAALAGRPRAARAVGNIMKGLGRSDVPAHRVIAAGGKLGGYGGNEHMKRALLVAEGVVVRNSRIKLQEYRWPISGPTAAGKSASSRTSPGKSSRTRRKSSRVRKV